MSQSKLPAKNPFIPQSKKSHNHDCKKVHPDMLSENSMLRIPLERKLAQPFCPICEARGRAHPRRVVRGLPYCPEHNREAVNRKLGTSGNEGAEKLNRARLTKYAEEQRSFAIAREQLMNEMMLKEASVLSEKNVAREEQVDADTEQYVETIRRNARQPGYGSNNASDALDSFLNGTDQEYYFKDDVTKKPSQPMEAEENESSEPMEDEENIFQEVPLHPNKVPKTRQPEVIPKESRPAEPRAAPSQDKLYAIIAQLEDEREKLEKQNNHLHDAITSTESNFNGAYQNMTNKFTEEIKMRDENIVHLKTLIGKDKAEVAEKASSLESQLNRFVKQLANNFPEQFAIIKSEIMKPENMNAKFLEDIVRIVLCY